MPFSVSAVVLFFAVHWSYVAIMAAKRVQMTAYWRVILYPLAAFGLALDVAFNLTFGTVMFVELPREWLFSHRVQRHVTSDGWRLSLALFFAKQLNVFDDHIKL